MTQDKFMELKRLFFGMQVVSPWPDPLPQGRILLPEDRHLTIAFLGETDFVSLQESLREMPRPPFQIGIAAQFDRCLFLPHREPRVAGWHVRFLEQKESFFAFQQQFVFWLKSNGQTPKEKGDFLPHVTIARSPFVIHEWKEAFQKLPLYLKDVQLIESLGHSHYRTCWSYPIEAPFESIDHTADVAFIIRGKSYEDLYLHAALALSFEFPPFLRFLSDSLPNDLASVIMQLNESLTRSDTEIGCPYKAVSLHDRMRPRADEIMEWEMIVDV